MIFVNIPLTNMRSTLGAIRKKPVPIVKRGEQKQLFFLNINVKRNNLSSNVKFTLNIYTNCKICLHIKRFKAD